MTTQGGVRTGLGLVGRVKGDPLRLTRSSPTRTSEQHVQSQGSETRWRVCSGVAPDIGSERVCGRRVSGGTGGYQIKEALRLFEMNPFHSRTWLPFAVGTSLAQRMPIT